MVPLFAWVPGPWEMILLLGLGVLLFGRRLPEIGRYLGKGIVEFKKGIRGLEDEVSDSVTRSEPIMEAPKPPPRVPTTAPKFEESSGPITSPPGV